MHSVREVRRIPAGQTVSGLGMLLDRAERLLRDGDAAASVEHLCNGLRELRAEVAPEVWSGVVKPACRAHPAWGLLGEDPITRRAYAKPRG